MTKAELVAKIAKDADITRKAAAVSLEALVRAIHGSLKKDDKIRVLDLGSFSVVQRKARAGVNPQTGKKLKIQAMKAPKFSAAKALKETVKKSK